MSGGAALKQPVAQAPPQVVMAFACCRLHHLCEHIVRRAYVRR